MKPVLLMADDFFPDPQSARERIVEGIFGDFTSPWDGVVYPGINRDIPESITDWLKMRLGLIVNGPIEPKAIFARVTTKNTGPAPHQIHCDTIMGMYSAHVYISTYWPEASGTSFWTHHSEGPKHTPATDLTRVLEDMNDVSRWTQTMVCQGKFNRLLVHDASFWHCAEPVGGWGENAEDGRVVLTCFFNTKAGRPE